MAEEIRKKRVSEMGEALSNASLELMNGCLDFLKGVDDNTVLRNDLYAAKAKLDESIAELYDDECSEDELAALKNHETWLLSQIKISKHIQEQLQALRREVEAEKLKLYECSVLHEKQGMSVCP